MSLRLLESVEYWIRLNEINTDVCMYALEFIHTLKNLEYVEVHAVQVDTH